ncbi:MAG: DUF285 domain-containing protein, partial [Clostridia bacterium]|nr:DUF285 domain-containing protein [Clostridia bacterium]
MKKIVATLMSLLFVVMMIPNISFAAQKRIYGEVKNNIMRIYYDDLQSTRTGQIHTLGYVNEGYLSSITTVVFNDSVKDYRPKDTDMWFGRMNNLTHIYNLNYLDTSNVTSMSCMFYGCSSLNELDLSSFDTSNVTHIYGMFYGCSSLSELDLSSFNTLNVTNMSYMFYGCSSLNELDLSSFDT